MANVEGTFLASNYESGRVVVDVASKIFMLNPAATPFLMFSSKLEGEPTGNPEFQWFEDGFLEWTDTAKSAASNTATTIYVNNADRYAVGHVVLNGTSGEQYLVTSVVSGSSYILATREFGETASATVLADDNLYILGTAALEGAESENGLYTAKTSAYNYTQQFRWAYEMTDLARGTSVRTGAAWPYESRKAADEFKLMMERQMLLGERKSAYSSGARRLATRGLRKFIDSGNSFNVSGVLPEFDFDDWVRAVFREGSGNSASQTKILLANDRLLAVINRFQKVRQQTSGSDNKYGVNITNYVTPHGTVKMVYHKLLDEYSPSAGYGLMYDPANVRIRYFVGNGVDGHVKLHTEIQANSATKREDEYRATAGLQVMHATTHGEIKNVNG